MQRLYEKIILEHLNNFRQMLFLVGSRQVGKTTLALTLRTITQADCFYLNFDILEDRTVILAGPKHIWQLIKGDELRNHKPIIVFDEIHKYAKWKNFLKGFFDSYSERIKIVVTGSARLDIYQKGGDSLMGRYIPYVICPLSVGELNNQFIPAQETQVQTEISDASFSNLWLYGGFPELYLKANKSFFLKMQTLRRHQLFYEDIRSLSSIQEVSQLEVMAELLKLQVGNLVNRASIAKKINVAVSTVSRWLSTLEAFYYCFTIKPWTKNISRSLIKEPKIYLWDWSLLEDTGARAENFIACHLLKAIHCWNDQGLGEYGLYYLRDKEKREVDFLVSKNNVAWFLVEVKYTDNQAISKNLYYYQEQTRAPYAFQVVVNKAYVHANCFESSNPIVVPARTFLSQLI